MAAQVHEAVESITVLEKSVHGSQERKKINQEGLKCKQPGIVTTGRQ